MVITPDKILYIQLNLDESDKKSLEKIFYPLNLMNEMICALFIQIGIYKKNPNLMIYFPNTTV